MRRVFVLLLAGLGPSTIAWAQDVPLIQFQSRELKDGKNFTDRISAVLSVGESSGQVSYEYPIDVPPGRGVTPRVALAYSSHARQSEFGYGWQLTMPIIERSERKGPMGAVFQYRNGHETSELVYTQTVGTWDEYHEVNERTFSRYLFDSRSNLWRILRLDGTRTELGNSTLYQRGPNLSAGATGTATWLPYRIYDTHNNYAEYQYATAPDGDRRISQIVYDGNTSTALTPAVTVTFTWATNWGTGVPVPLSYHSGFLRAFGQDRLASITVTAGPESSGGHNPATVPTNSPQSRRYDFTYTASTGVNFNNMFYLTEAFIEGFPKVVFTYSDPQSDGGIDEQHELAPLDTDPLTSSTRASIRVRASPART